MDNVTIHKGSIGVKEVIAILIFVGGLITAYTGFQKSIGQYEIRVQTLENAQRASSRNYEKIDTKLDGIKDAVYELKVEVQKKQDKK